jgi:D-serine deaminase-like pyridoxal phosphate-dependent protein
VRVDALSPWLGAAIADLDTPALLVDLDVLDRNLNRMAEWSRRTGCAVRPHAKAHKSPLIARKQLDRGAIGITCSKVGEAEVLVAGGVSGILISSEVVGRAKIARLLALARHAELLVVVDDPGNAADLSAAASAAGLTLAVLVEVNVGQERCGVEPGEPAAELAAQVLALPGLRFEGLQGYEGNLQHVRDPDERRERCLVSMARLIESRRAVEARGIPIRIVSTAGTGTHAIAGEIEGVTEVQPGSYIWMDSDYLGVAGLPYEGGLTLLTTVVSRQRRGAAVVDAGWKSITIEAGMPVVKGAAGLTYAPAGDEHGKLLAADESSLPPLGARVELVPSHCDTTVNLHDHLFALRDGRVEAVWPIPARGRVA